MSFNGSMGKIGGSFALDLPRFERGRKPSSWGSLVRETLDLGSALAELVLDPLEAAVEVVNPADRRFPLGGKTGDDERDGGPQIRRHDRRALEPAHSRDQSRVALELDAGAEPRQFLHMHEAVFEDGLAHLRGARGGSHASDVVGWVCGG